jgi:hypothetical protein
MESEVVKIKKDGISVDSSWTSSISSSDSSSFTLSDLYHEAIKINEEEEKFYTALDCVGHTCFYKRTSEGFFILASGYNFSPSYDVCEKPIKLSEVEIQTIFTDYRSHGYHCSREITKEEYEKEME